MRSCESVPRFLTREDEHKVKRLCLPAQTGESREAIHTTTVRLCLPAMPAHAGQTGEPQRGNPRLHSILLPNITSSLQAVTNKIQLLYIVTRFPLEYQPW